MSVPRTRVPRAHAPVCACLCCTHTNRCTWHSPSLLLKPGGSFCLSTHGLNLLVSEEVGDGGLFLGALPLQSLSPSVVRLHWGQLQTHCVTQGVPRAPPQGAPHNAVGVTNFGTGSNPVPLLCSPQAPRGLAQRSGCLRRPAELTSRPSIPAPEGCAWCPWSSLTPCCGRSEQTLEDKGRRRAAWRRRSLSWGLPHREEWM